MARRDAGLLPSPLEPVRREQKIDPWLPRIEEWVERSKAKIRADVAFKNLRRLALMARSARYAGRWRRSRRPIGPGDGGCIGRGSPSRACGTPYRWGVETPGVGFDCSGLTQAAYAAAGIVILRTSEAQWSALPHVPLDQLEPGDLVFFGPGEFLAGLPGHVGIYTGSGEMVDAPHTGATVRIEKLPAWPTCRCRKSRPGLPSWTLTPEGS